MLFFLMPQIGKLCLHYLGKLKSYTLGRRNYLPRDVPVMVACEKLSAKCSFTLIISSNISLSMMALLILVENYQVKLCQTDATYIKKSILQNIKIEQKTVLHVVRSVLQKIKLCSQEFFIFIYLFMYLFILS